VLLGQSQTVFPLLLPSGVAEKLTGRRFEDAGTTEIVEPEGVGALVELRFRDLTHLFDGLNPSNGCLLGRGRRFRRGIHRRRSIRDRHGLKHLPGGRRWHWKQLTDVHCAGVHCDSLSLAVPQRFEQDEDARNKKEEQQRNGDDTVFDWAYHRQDPMAEIDDGISTTHSR